MGEMRAIGPEGDTKLVWNANNTAEVDAAEQMFDTLTAKGYAAYSVAEGGGQGEVIRGFDPTAQKIILAPPMAGGSPTH